MATRVTSVSPLNLVLDKVLTISGAECLVPPVSHCPRSGCHNLTLTHPIAVEGRLYTLKRGVLPIFSHSLYCHTCNTRFHPNYSVQNADDEASRRQYYDFGPSVPEFIHVTQTSYVESQLCTYIEMQMAMMHASAEGIARVYNRALGASEHGNVHLKEEFDAELVLDAFFYNAILRDKLAHRELLSLPHRGSQRHRLDEAMKERNYRMVGTGQEMWAHRCKRCMKFYQGADGNWYVITGGVHDGVTVRHLACSVHDCTEPLPSQKARFCTTHSPLKNVCYIYSCDAPVQAGFSTCVAESHRAHELASLERHAAMFQLHNRLQHAGIPQIPSAAPSSSEPRVKGKNSRHWTHNEQLFVKCCGVIISRATLYGSESITGLFLKATFPPQYPGAMPSYIFYDNNCSFQKHLKASKDPYFDKVGLPVDVWHFKCKHKEGDLFCQEHCNLARFRELVGENDAWVFNSSVAEQSNAWFGKFQSVVQEMNVLRYNFFLDEMIAIHNRHVVAQLALDGQKPSLMSEEYLRGGMTYVPPSSTSST
ncbi:hypothetical protein C8R44DRAFT_626848 [Mycena epipterygia]|nr:hypothetical protein C8R44DRAFT_626848 [Mycena epipterygia]